MFFVLSKIVGFVADPLVFISSFFLIGLFMRKKYKRRSYLLIAFTLLIFFSNGFIYQIFFEKWEVKATKLLESYDYGILLGGMISLNSTENEIKFGQSSDRLLYTIKLYKEKRISKIIISGASGSLQSDIIESEFLKNYLIKTGIPEHDIISETQSKNTYENALFTSKLILSESSSNRPTCLLITSDYHIRRALACFKTNNLKIDPYTKSLEQKYIVIEDFIVPQSYLISKWKVLLHEIIGYYTYKCVGYI